MLSLTQPCLSLRQFKGAFFLSILGKEVNFIGLSSNHLLWGAFVLSSGVAPQCHYPWHLQHSSLFSAVRFFRVSLISQEHSPCSSAIVLVENRFEFSYGETFPSFTFHSLNKHLSNAFRCQVPKVAKRIGQSLPSKTQRPVGLVPLLQKLVLCIVGSLVILS